MKNLIKAIIVRTERVYQKNQFLTSFWAIFLNPAFISRNRLYKELLKRKSHVSGDVLDYGCGNMPYKSIFNFNEYIGLEFGYKKNSTKELVFFNGKEIPFPDNTFDTIICTEVLEHVENPEHILKELHRVQKSGGKIIVSVPFVWVEHAHPHDYRRYTQEGLEFILKRNGYNIVETVKTTRFILSLTQILAFMISQKLFIYKYYNIFTLTYNVFIQTLFISPLFIIGYFFNAFIRDNKKVFPLNIIAIAIK